MQKPSTRVALDAAAAAAACSSSSPLAVPPAPLYAVSVARQAQAYCARVVWRSPRPAALEARETPPVLAAVA